VCLWVGGVVWSRVAKRFQRHKKKKSSEVCCGMKLKVNTDGSKEHWNLDRWYSKLWGAPCGLNNANALVRLERGFFLQTTSNGGKERCANIGQSQYLWATWNPLMSITANINECVGEKKTTIFLVNTNQYEYAVTYSATFSKSDNSVRFSFSQHLRR